MFHMYTVISVILVMGIFFRPALGQQQIVYTDESLAEIKDKVENKTAILLDVRELSEWNDGHIKQAVLVPTSTLKSEDDRAEAVKSLDKSLPIYCHCKAGGRAMVCGQWLKDLGYDIRPLRQSYKSIVQAGFVEVKE